MWRMGILWTHRHRIYERNSARGCAIIAVVGADGLLGSHFIRRFPLDTIGFTHHDLDITDYAALGDALYRCLPDAVINCAGIVPRHPGPDHSMAVNSDAPHQLAALGQQLGFKLIHISTDCVYDFKDGLYTEVDAPNSQTLYGISKKAGEITESPHLTVRTSFVGWPDPKGRGLLAWLHDQQGWRVPGYKNYQWNGLTTTVLADCLYELAYSSVTGLRHVFGETISKYDVLKIVSERYKWENLIDPMDEPVANATLATIWDDALKFLPVTAFEEQVDLMFRARDYA